MATAAELTIVGVEKFVESGQLKPHQVVTQGIYEDRGVVPLSFRSRLSDAKSRSMRNHDR